MGAGASAIAGIGGSLISGYYSDRAAKRQEELMKRQLQLGQQQTAYETELQQQNLEYQKGLAEDALQYERDKIASYEQQQDMQRRLAQQEYDKFEATFGPIQENLANYYQSLSPADYAKYGKGTIDEAYQQASESLSKNLAQRGIQGGGVEAGAQSNLMSQTALAQGQNLLNAETQYRNEQNQFLQSGKNMSQQANSLLASYNPSVVGNMAGTALQGGAGVGNAYAMKPSYQGQFNALGNMANMYGQSSAGWGNAMGGFMNMGIKGLDNYFNTSGNASVQPFGATEPYTGYGYGS